MTPARFAAITSRYTSLRLALVGDFCLDRYLEIDPARAELLLVLFGALFPLGRAVP